MHCAEKRERFGDCRSLYICVGEKTTHENIVTKVFPSDFYFSTNRDAIMEYLLNGTCNVMMSNFPVETTAKLEMEAGRDAYFAVEPSSIEPHALVTRYELDGGREFSDIAT